MVSAVSYVGISGGPGSALGTRRRGEVLVGAIHAAVIDELAHHGYAGFTVEGVAERAQVGKASIYRRWPGKEELVLDTLDALLPRFDDVPDTGAIRTDLIAAMRRMAAALNGPAGTAVRGCQAGAEELYDAVRRRLIEPRRQVLSRIMRRAVARGEVRPDAAKPRLIDAGPMLLQAELMRDGRISDRSVVALIDEVLLPMLRP